MAHTLLISFKLPSISPQGVCPSPQTSGRSYNAHGIFSVHAASFYVQHLLCTCMPRLGIHPHRVLPVSPRTTTVCFSASPTACRSRGLVSVGLCCSSGRTRRWLTTTTNESPDDEVAAQCNYQQKNCQAGGKLSLGCMASDTDRATVCMTDTDATSDLHNRR